MPFRAADEADQNGITLPFPDLQTGVPGPMPGKTSADEGKPIQFRAPALAMRHGACVGWTKY